MFSANSRRMLFISYYAVTVLLFFSLFGSIKWLTYVKLMTAGSAANAIVTTTSCSNSMTFSYRFSVGGKSFDGSGGDGYGNQPCTSLKPGDTALIYYLESNPDKNISGDPAARLISEFSAIALVAFFVPILGLLLIFALSRFWQKRKNG